MKISKSLLVGGTVALLGLAYLKSKEVVKTSEQVQEQATTQIPESVPEFVPQEEINPIERIPRHEIVADDVDTPLVNEQVNYEPAPVYVTERPVVIPVDTVPTFIDITARSDEIQTFDVFTPSFSIFANQTLTLAAGEQQVLDAPKISAREIVVQDPSKDNLVCFMRFDAGRINRGTNYALVVTAKRASDGASVSSSVSLIIPDAGSYGYGWWNWYSVYCWFSSDGFESADEREYYLECIVVRNGASIAVNKIYFTGQNKR